MGSTTSKSSVACTTSTSEDAEQVAKLAAGAAVDAVLAAGSQLPVVGGLVALLAKVKQNYGELAAQEQEAAEVAAWAMEMDGIFVALQARLSEPGADSPVDGAMRVIVNSAANKIGELCLIAEHVSQGSKPANFVRGALFKAEFKAAQAAVQKAADRLETALAVDTNLTVHGIDVKVDRLEAMMAQMLAKIEASSAEADQKQVLRGLVRTVQDQPQHAMAHNNLGLRTSTEPRRCTARRSSSTRRTRWRT